MNNDITDEESFSWINHFSENLIGILLLIIAILIIVVVEHIARFNATIFSIPSPIPGISSSNPMSSSNPITTHSNSIMKHLKSKGNKIKKFKK